MELVQRVIGLLMVDSDAVEYRACLKDDQSGSVEPTQDDAFAFHEDWSSKKK